jgi:hypothetical protein
VTDHDPAPAGPPAPDPTGAGGGWVRGDATTALAWWMVEHRSAYTPEALDRAALAAGYTAEQVADARRRADVRIRKTERLQPVRRTARRTVLLAYGVVWVALVVGLFAGRPEGSLDFTELLVVVLSVSMAIALAMSLAAIRQADPDPERPARAVALLLALPTILLLAIAGVCLPGVVS